jgi:transposase-like protein
MWKFLKQLFKKRCPRCKSKETHVETYVAYSMGGNPTHTGYGCDNCKNYWVHNAPKE